LWEESFAMFRQGFVRVVFVLAALSPAAAFAQATAAISGCVRDASGGATPGVIIRVSNQTGGATRETVSDTDGVFRVDALAAGGYRIEARLDGFEPGVRQQVLTAGQTAAVDLV